MYWIVEEDGSLCIKKAATTTSKPDCLVKECSTFCEAQLWLTRELNFRILQLSKKKQKIRKLRASDIDYFSSIYGLVSP